MGRKVGVLEWVCREGLRVGDGWYVDWDTRMNLGVSDLHPSHW